MKDFWSKKNYFPFSLLYEIIIQNNFWCLSRLWLSFGFLHCSLIPFSEWANQIPLFRHRRSRRRILLWWKGIPNIPCLPGTWVISPVTIRRRTVSRGHQNLKGSSRVDICRWLPLVCLSWIDTVFCWWLNSGGTIGTGLFLGSGQALAKSGPAGALIGYTFVGTIIFSVMQSLGEMATYIPISGAFTAYATRFVDPSLGFAMGWIYWFSWAMTYSLELTATGLIIQYWNQNLSIGSFIGAGCRISQRLSVSA